MARARTLKPSFFHDAELLECAFWVRVLFAGLWVYADRRGVLADNPKQIKIDVFPSDDVDVEAGLAELASRGFIARYTAQGKRCLQVVAFLRHQNPHKDEQPNHLPSKEECEQGVGMVAAPGQQSANPAVSTTNTDSLNPEPVSPPTGADTPSVRYSREFEAFWSVWSQPPSKGHGSKKEAYDAWKALGLDARGRDAARQEVVNGLRAWQQTRKWREGYVRDCHRWLRARGWADEVPDEPQPRGSPPAPPRGANAFYEAALRAQERADEDGRGGEGAGPHLSALLADTGGGRPEHRSDDRDVAAGAGGRALEPVWREGP